LCSRGGILQAAPCPCTHLLQLHEVLKGLVVIVLKPHRLALARLVGVRVTASTCAVTDTRTNLVISCGRHKTIRFQTHDKVFAV
jgi:hypothetical protein